ncbi:MAG: exopolysaccharide biosynthesis protein [Rhodanobacteraceae bacterium]|nr:exopolysaccharide biosynthesis protein [Rhodanobacteraceae bacterium]MBL0041312.1 exopolysaccharide biosynthesis protein [Xanthomonadales bacterium]MBP6077476.1 exopolysaccharide biosynthesis protein [Xanthomonadales bacterium]MBP7624514.1 exopolysaccharide biosynthesis protein [Xanthomonadales bacterium]
MGLRKRTPRPKPPRVSDLLGATLAAWDQERIDFGQLVDAIHERGFGALILLAALPCLIPVPVGFMGGIFGTLLSLVGLQMLAGFDHPWLPGFVRRLQIPKTSVAKFVQVLDPWLSRIEKLCKPSWTFFLNRHAHRFTGLLLVFLGIELALPVPMTNMPFAIAMIGYAMALLERDGRWLAALWAVTLIQIGAAFWFGDWVVMHLGGFIESVRSLFS